MEFRRVIALVLMLASNAQSLTVASGSQTAVNPIRRVVTMLQMMQKQVDAEGKKRGRSI
jgi:hypothetical protein